MLIDTTGVIITHPGIHYGLRHIFLSDSVYLSAEGCNIYLANIARGARAAITVFEGETVSQASDPLSWWSWRFAGERKLGKENGLDQISPSQWLVWGWAFIQLNSNTGSGL